MPTSASEVMARTRTLKLKQKSHSMNLGPRLLEPGGSLRKQIVCTQVNRKKTKKPEKVTEVRHGRSDTLGHVIALLSLAYVLTPLQLEGRFLFWPMDQKEGPCLKVYKMKVNCFRAALSPTNCIYIF